MAISDYKNNIPLANDRLSLSQNDLLQNFAALEDWIGVDHGGSQSPTDAGKHKKSTYPRQGATPSFSANEIGVYNLLNATTGVSELYVRKGSGTEIPFTAFQSNGTSSNGWTYLPSGMIMKWGTIAVSSTSGNINVNNAPPSGSGGPALATIDQAFLTARAGGNNYTVRIASLVGPATINWEASNVTGTHALTYLAIGR